MNLWSARLLLLAAVVFVLAIILMQPILTP
jgi:hypothetical protein